MIIQNLVKEANVANMMIVKIILMQMAVMVNFIQVKNVQKYHANKNYLKLNQKCCAGFGG